jgi:phosphoglycerate dehydrogenase-like enzyme
MEDITLLVLGDPAEPTFGRLSELGRQVHFTIGKTAEELTPQNEARVLFNWSGGKEDVRRAMEFAPKLEWIHTRSAGLDRLLFPELINSPIPLTNGTGVFSQALGEFVILGALYFAKYVPRLLKTKADRTWDSSGVYEVAKQTMGIVGHGDIGRAAAWRAKVLGMRVLALRRDPSPRPGDEHVDRVYSTGDILEMLPQCDYVVVTAPLTPETKGLVGKREFAAMKPEAIIMNVGRGPVIDEAAMIEALQTNRIRGAALDVFDVEPLPHDSPFWSMDNVLISPHTADHTQDWLDDAITFFLEQFARWRKGEPLKNIIDKHAGY